MTVSAAARAPKVSVFISSYNHAGYLRACLDSILTQTYPDFEIVVVDDGSKDNSHSILTEYQERYPEKVRYFWHENHANRGISISCNLALEKTRGEYLAWCGSDDAWEPDKLAQQVRFLDADPRVGFVYARVSLIDSAGSPLPGELGLDINAASDPIARMLEGNWVPASTAVIRRACLDQIGVFDEGVVYSDWTLWMRALSYWQAGFIPNILARYRLHDSNVSAGIDRKKDYRANINALLALRERASDGDGRLGQPRSRALIEMTLAYYYFAIGDEDSAIRCLEQADVVYPALRENSTVLKEWFRKQANQNYQYAANYRAEKDFALAVLGYAAAGRINIDDGLRGYLNFLQHASCSIAHYQNRELRPARQAALQSLKANPAEWLRYKTLRSILFETIIGGQASNALRRVKRRLQLKSNEKNA